VGGLDEFFSSSSQRDDNKNMMNNSNSSPMVIFPLEIGSNQIFSTIQLFTANLGNYKPIEISKHYIPIHFVVFVLTNISRSIVRIIVLTHHQHKIQKCEPNDVMISFDSSSFRCSRGINTNLY